MCWTISQNDFTDAGKSIQTIEVDKSVKPIALTAIEIGLICAAKLQLNSLFLLIFSFKYQPKPNKNALPKKLPQAKKGTFLKM